VDYISAFFTFSYLLTYYRCELIRLSSALRDSKISLLDFKTHLWGWCPYWGWTDRNQPPTLLPLTSPVERH